MGLDQWLTKKYYIGACYEHNGVSGNDFEITRTTIDHRKKEKPELVRTVKFPIENLEDIKYRIGYWRKSNHIHKWFVDNVQNGTDDCNEYTVEPELLKKLLSDCRATLEAYKKAKEVVKERNRLASDEKIIQLLFNDEIYADNVADITEHFNLQKGFFFGADFIGEWFFDDLEYTISIIEPEIEELENADKPFFTSIEYSSSW